MKAIAPPMSKALLAMATATVAALALFAPRSEKTRAGEYGAEFLSMGTVGSVRFTCCAGRDAMGRAEGGAEIVRAAFAEVEAAASVFRGDSPIARLNRDGAVTLPPPANGGFDLAAVIRAALDAARESDGAFDPTVNPLMRLWGFRKGAAEATMPSGEALRAALEKVGWREVRLETLDGGATRVSFARAGMELDLGGIAKGAAVDFAFERLRAAGYADFVVNLGGNIRVSGRPHPRRRTWHVAVRDPGNPSRTVDGALELADGEAVATSGSYERFVEIGGRRYSHIIDPRTGMPVARGGSVSVVAPSAMRADAWSTAFFVQGKSADGGARCIKLQSM